MVKFDWTFICTGAVKLAPEFRVNVLFASKVVKDPAFHIPAIVIAPEETRLVAEPVEPPLFVSVEVIKLVNPVIEEPVFMVKVESVVRVPVPDRVPLRLTAAVPLPNVGLLPRGKE